MRIHCGGHHPSSIIGMDDEHSCRGIHENLDSWSHRCHRIPRIPAVWWIPDTMQVEVFCAAPQRASPVAVDAILSSPLTAVGSTRRGHDQILVLASRSTSPRTLRCSSWVRQGFRLKSSDRCLAFLQSRTPICAERAVVAWFGICNCFGVFLIALPWCGTRTRHAIDVGVWSRLVSDFRIHPQSLCCWLFQRSAPYEQNGDIYFVCLPVVHLGHWGYEICNPCFSCEMVAT